MSYNFFPLTNKMPGSQNVAIQKGSDIKHGFLFSNEVMPHQTIYLKLDNITMYFNPF